jgi:hypothetical protein
VALPADKRQGGADKMQRVGSPFIGACTGSDVMAQRGVYPTAVLGQHERARAGAEHNEGG